VIVAVPAATPVITPEEDPIEATAVLLLLHTPPDVLLLSRDEAPIHTVVTPVIGVGVLTVTKTELKPMPHEFETA